MNRIFSKNFESVLKKYFQCGLESSKTVRFELSKLNKLHDPKDKDIFVRFPKKELRIFFKIPCPVDLELQNVGEFKSYNIIDVMKSLRESHNINESWVCQRCPQREKCQVKDQPPKERHTHLTDLVKGLYSLSLAEQNLIEKVSKGSIGSEQEKEGEGNTIAEEREQNQSSTENVSEKEAGLLSEALDNKTCIAAQSLEYKEWSSVLKITDTLERILDDLYNNHGIDTKTSLTEFKEYQKEKQKQNREFLSQSEKKTADASSGKAKINIIKDDDDDDEEEKGEEKSSQKGLKKEDDEEEDSEEEINMSKTKGKYQKGKINRREEMTYAREGEGSYQGNNPRKFQNKYKKSEEIEPEASGIESEQMKPSSYRTIKRDFNEERPKYGDEMHKTRRPNRYRENTEGSFDTSPNNYERKNYGDNYKNRYRDTRTDENNFKPRYYEEGKRENNYYRENRRNSDFKGKYIKNDYRGNDDFARKDFNDDSGGKNYKDSLERGQRKNQYQGERKSYQKPNNRRFEKDDFDFKDDDENSRNKK